MFVFISMCTRKVTYRYCICAVNVIRSLSCQYQHMNNFNVID